MHTIRSNFDVLTGCDVYSFRSRRRKTFFQRYGTPLALMAIGGACASFGFLVPASGGGATNRVFNDGLKIELDRSSPAFAALEDAWSSNEVAAEPTRVVLQSVELNAGTPAAALAQRIARDNVREQVLFRHEVAAREANSQAMAKAAADILHKMASHFEAPEPAAVVVEERHPDEIPARPFVAQAMPTIQQAVQAAAATEHKTISLTDLRMSREELLGSLFLPIANSTNAPARRVLPASVFGRHAVPYNKVVARGPATAAADELPAKVGAESKNHPAVLGDMKATSQDPSAVSTPSHQVVIAGSLEFTEGLAVSNSMDRVVLYREVDGDLQESGAVWLREGRYEIFVEETVGNLTAELRTPYGDVVGRGRVDLATVSQTSAQHRINGVVLRLTPIIQGVSGTVVSLRSNGQKPLLKGAAIEFRDLPLTATSEKGGHFAESNLIEGSVAIAKITHPNYWGELAFAHAGGDNQFELIPDQDGQMVRVLADRLRESDPAKIQRALVWGRVTAGGKPVAGAQVVLANGDRPVRPVYFNSSGQPDIRAHETTANGMYAYYPVTEGTQAVRVWLDDNEASATEPILFPAGAGLVSHIDLETRSTVTVKVRVFDALKTDLQLAASLTAPTGGTAQAISGMGEMHVMKSNAPLIVDADLGTAYEKIRVTMSRDQRNLLIPAVTPAWLEGVQGFAHLNSAIDGGTVIGFVQSKAPFKVAMEPGSLTSFARVVYFDAKGEPNNMDFGSPGGGYVIFGVPQGFRTITVQGFWIFSGSFGCHGC